MIQPQTSKTGTVFNSEGCSGESGPFFKKLNLKTKQNYGVFFTQTCIYSFRFSFVTILIYYAKIISDGFNATDTRAPTELLSEHLKSRMQRMFWPLGLVA